LQGESASCFRANAPFNNIMKVDSFDGAKRSTELTPKSPPFKVETQSTAKSLP